MFLPHNIMLLTELPLELRVEILAFSSHRKDLKSAILSTRTFQEAFYACKLYVLESVDYTEFIGIILRKSSEGLHDDVSFHVKQVVQKMENKPSASLYARATWQILSQNGIPRAMRTTP